MNPLEILLVAIFSISIFGMACAMIKEIRESRRNKSKSVSINRYVVDDIISIEDMKELIEKNPALRERIAGYVI
jgi:hypothetical protein